MPSHETEDLQALAENDQAFRMWTIEHMTRVEADLTWIKKVYSPTLATTVLLSLFALIDVLWRLGGH
jgi:hypothetical protein